MNKPIALSIQTVLAFVILFAVVGCAGRNDPFLQRMAVLPKGEICNIAVLPFKNETDYPQGDILACRIFMAELINTGHYRIAQEGDIRRIYQQMNIFPGQMPDFDQIRMLSTLLDAQLIIAGKVIEMSDKKIADQVNPKLALSLQIYEGSSGRSLLSTYHRREGSQYRKVMHIGLINTVTSLAQRMSQEILASWNQEGLQKCTN